MSHFTNGTIPILAEHKVLSNFGFATTVHLINFAGYY